MRPGVNFNNLSAAQALQARTMALDALASLGLKP